MGMALSQLPEGLEKAQVCMERERERARAKQRRESERVRERQGERDREREACAGKSWVRNPRQVCPPALPSGSRSSPRASRKPRSAHHGPLM